MQFNKIDYENYENFKFNKDIDWKNWNQKFDGFKKYADVKSVLVYGAHLEMQPEYSIVIPTFRREDLLRESIESAINQINYEQEYEIIVIDNYCDIDLPTDKMMREYCEKNLNITYYRNSKNIGMFANWNRCIEVCKSKWLCILHDDDYITSDYLSTMTSFNLTEDIGIVFNEQNILDETGIIATNYRNKIAKIREFINEIKKKQKAKIIPWKFPQLASSCATLYNKALSMEIGGFDDTYDPACDWIMWGKMEFYHKTYRTGKRLCYYRFLCNGFLRSEIQRYVLIYGLIFAKKYYESKNYSRKKVCRLYSKYVIRVYKNMTTSNPGRLEFYNQVLEELKLEKKYYSDFVQNRIYFEYLVKQGLEKIFCM